MSRTTNIMEATTTTEHTGCPFRSIAGLEREPPRAYNRIETRAGEVVARFGRRGSDVIRVSSMGVMRLARFMIKASYTSEGVKGLLKEGGTGRRDAVGKLLADLGGTLESFDYAFGDDDAYVIVELPDNVSAAALALAVGAAGAVRIKTTVLLTPEEVDKAAKTTVNYRAPGK